ncbi:MAG: hypothetical protein ACJ8LG_05165 [Massilia sp.]
MPINCLAGKLGLAAILLAPSLSQAGRPLVTDDASVVRAGTCEIEAWTNHRSGGDEYWTVPHCAAGAWELAGGVSRSRPPASGTGPESALLAAKTLFRPLRRNSWGIGITLSNQFGGWRGVLGDLAAVVPFSMSLFDDRVLVHVNAGWQRPRGAHSGATWALAAEWNATRRIGLTLEAYGSQHGRSYLQAGARYDLLPNRLTLDAALGQRISLRGLEHYVAVGLTLTVRQP